MLTDFFYSHPIWEVGLLVVGVWSGLALLGLIIFHRLIKVSTRRHDTETVGLTYAIIAVIYAVLIAVIVVGVWETFARSDEIATAEANVLSNLVLDATELPGPVASAVHADLVGYIDAVMKSEWPAQRAGSLGEAVFEPGWTLLGHLTTQIATFEPTTLGQGVNKGEMLRGVNDLIKARRSRILAAGAHLPDIIWQILLLAGAVAVLYTYLFGAHSFAIHLAVTGLVSASIALIFVLIIALDYPFRGDVSVGDDAFASVLSTAESGPAAGGPHHAE